MEFFLDLLVFFIALVAFSKLSGYTKRIEALEQKVAQLESTGEEPRVEPADVVIAEED